MADLNALLIFAKVAEMRSFSEAARRLHMPISSVSRRVAELEQQLGVRLLERSTRSLRLTDVGSDVVEHARRGAEAGEAVDQIILDLGASVSGLLRLSAPPGLSESLLAPVIAAFQLANPDVCVQVLVTERATDPAVDDVDLGFAVGPLKDSALIARRVLTYRHQLLASPEYVARHAPPEHPRDLLAHRLVAFSRGARDDHWGFARADGTDEEELTFRPRLSANDYAGLAAALLAGAGIGELPPVVQPGLLRDGRLVEVMRDWRFRPVDLAVVHPGGPYVPRAVRVFKEFVVRMAPLLFPTLPI